MNDELKQYDSLEQYLKERDTAANDESAKYDTQEEKYAAERAFLNGAIWAEENRRPQVRAFNVAMINQLKEQMLQQAHDILDTAEAIGEFAKPRYVDYPEQQQGAYWIDPGDELPLEGERVVIDTGDTQYFHTYNGIAGEFDKYKRWMRLPL